MWTEPADRGSNLAHFPQQPSQRSFEHAEPQLPDAERRIVCELIRQARQITVCTQPGAIVLLAALDTAMEAAVSHGE